MAGRQPLLRGTGQSDADMMGFNILNVGAVGDIQQATLIVEPGLAVAGEVGERGSGLPFSSIEAAVAVALAGDVIYLRPGIHAFDGTIDIFHLTGLKIIGYGAVITSLSEVNENIKFTIRSADVTIEGIEFNGGVTDTPVDAGEGCITVSETGFTLRNCFIHDQNGYGVHMPEHYDGIQILDCTIQTCTAGVFGEADVDTTTDTEGVWIKRCKIQHNRTFGVLLTGPGPDSTHFITHIQITDNEFSTNDTDQGALPALGLTFACQGAQIDGNHFEDESSGIYLSQVKSSSVSNNYIKGVNANAIWLVGCIAIKVNDNLIDSRNSAGAAATNAPILIAGQYAAPNDAAQFVITGNELVFPKSNAVSISVSNATGVIINSNRIEGTILLAALASVMVDGNLFSIPQTSQAILIDASDRGCNNITISCNRYRFTGASISRCIATVDASATSIDDVLIIGNATQPTQTFGQGTYVHSGSNLATKVVQIGNVPENATITAGWANTGTPQAQVLVSQAYGVDAQGRRRSRTAKFKTVNAAITAASSGDTVVVEDGVFNEKLSAKDGITVRFLPQATLRSTNAGGCIVSSADNQAFTVYHEHEAIVCTQNSVQAVLWTHTGSTLYLHASVDHQGGGTLPYALLAQNGLVEVWGFLKAALTAVELSSGNPVVFLHGGLTANYDIQGGTGSGLRVLAGEFTAINASIVGIGSVGVTLNMTAANIANFKRCTIAAFGTNAAAISIATVGASVPLLRDCVLVADSGATQAITAGSAQTILLYGQTVANKGSDPPTNVTFDGGGTYDVDSSVTID